MFDHWSHVSNYDLLKTMDAFQLENIKFIIYTLFCHIKASSWHLFNSFFSKDIIFKHTPISGYMRWHDQVSAWLTYRVLVLNRSKEPCKIIMSFRKQIWAISLLINIVVYIGFTDLTLCKLLLSKKQNN